MKRIILRSFFVASISILLTSCGLFNFGGSTNPTYMAQGSLESRLLKQGVAKGDPVFIRIFKEEKLLELWMQQKNGRYIHFANYPICNFSGLLGPKKYEGDRQSPEGFYRVYRNSLNPNSRFYKSFNLGYPNLYDRTHGRTGSYLMVHGKCESVGCYAMTDQQIKEIYDLVEAALQNGQSYINVHAFPFRMTSQRLRQVKNSEHYEFWRDLAPAFEQFEKTKIPPRVDVRNRKYWVN